MPRDRGVRLSNSPLWVAGVALSASACGSPPSPPVVPVTVDGSSTKTESAAAREPAYEVAAVQAPAQTSVDGELDEWGAPGGGEADVSNMAVALGAEGLFVAARLTEGARGGFWLGVAGSPSELPPVGVLTRTGGDEVDPWMEVVEPGCTAPRYGDHADDRVEGPECLAAREADDRVVETHGRRFQRWYRVEAGGLQLVGEGGALAAVTGAQVVFRPRGTGATAEVSIPLAALPRMGQAPVVDLWLAARGLASARGPELPSLLDAKNNRELPQPVAFEPMAALRAQAFERSLWMSYHPADPLHVEVMRYPSQDERGSFVTRVEPLYRKQATIGEAEVGYLTIAPPPGLAREGESDRMALVIQAKGEVTVLPMEGAPLAVTPRGGGLHVLSLVLFQRMIHDGSPDSVFIRSRRARLSVLRVEPDGEYGPVALDGDVPSGWSEVEALQDGESIGLRGLPEVWTTVPSPLAGKRVELRWRWDEAKKAYHAEKPKRVGR